MKTQVFVMASTFAAAIPSDVGPQPGPQLPKARIAGCHKKVQSGVEAGTFISETSQCKLDDKSIFRERVA